MKPLPRDIAQLLGIPTNASYVEGNPESENLQDPLGEEFMDTQEDQEEFERDERERERGETEEESIEMGNSLNGGL